MKEFIKKLKWLFKRNKPCYKACVGCEYYQLCGKEHNSI